MKSCMVKRNGKRRKICCENNCVWNENHWKHEYENGCYKFTKLKACKETDGFMTIEEAKREGLIK